jgi:hypothetical protein
MSAKAALTADGCMQSDESELRASRHKSDNPARWCMALLDDNFSVTDPSRAFRARGTCGSILFPSLDVVVIIQRFLAPHRLSI